MACFRLAPIVLLLATLPSLAQRRPPRPADPPAAPPATAETPAVEPLRTAADRPVDVRHIRLDLKVDLPGKTVVGKASLEMKALRALDSFALDAVDFEVKRVTFQPAAAKDAQPVPFRHDGKHLTVMPTEPWPEGRAGTLVVEYVVRDPKDGLFFFRPTAAEPNVPLTVWSQGEAVTNRYWFPSFDHPDQRQTTELVVTVADGFEVLSNGKLVARRANPDKTVTFHWKQDKPHVSYLVTLVVGQFDIVEEDWKGLPVSYYVPKGRKDEVARTFGRTREMLTFFSKRFGIDYPWEKYAQVVVEQFTSGGMENTSATTLTDRALHDARSFLDSNADSLIAHELAHQWWGDLLTCRDWAHLWLNEGFASYMEVVWAEHDRGADEAAYNLVGKARAAVAGGRARPVVDRRYRFAREMFDARAYPKGAWVLHMLRRRLGDETFWKGIQAYGTEYRLKSVETSDFRKTMERVSGRNLEQFFYDATERPGHPVLEVTTDYLPDTKQARVRVRQTQAGEPFHFPLVVQFGDGPSAAGIRLSVDVGEKDVVTFVPLAGPPRLVVVDPEQALLAEITEVKGRDLWAAQLTDAPGVAARVRAAEQFGKSKQPGDRERLAKALQEEKFWGVRAEITAALAASGGDVCRDALIAGLRADHPKVRRACAEQLAIFRRDAKVAAALKGLLQKGDASYFVESAALSSYARLQQPDTVNVLLPWLAKPSHSEVLRSAALRGLGESQDLGALDTLISWTKRGKPRMARVGALDALARLAQTANPTDEQRKAIVTALAASLDGEGPLVRRTAVAALRDLGRSAVPQVPTLEVIARHDPDPRIQDLAQKVVEQIRANVPAPVEVTRLREELDRLKRANEALQERVERFEKLERKGP